MEAENPQLDWWQPRPSDEEMRQVQARLAAACRHAALAERRYKVAQARRHVAWHELLRRLWEN